MPIFAIDYDGTIADTNAEKVKWIRANLPDLGREVHPWECDRTNCVPIIGLENYERMSAYVYERPSTMEAHEIPGAGAALRALCKAGDVYVITARPPRRIAFAEEWLTGQDLIGCVRGILTSVGSDKASVCKKVKAEVLIDDDARHLSDDSLSWLRRVLLQHGRKEAPDCAAGVVFCRSWEQVLGHLGL